MKNILITGSGGFLASHLVPFLDDPYLDRQGKYPPCNLTRQKDIYNLLNHSQPEIIIHLAANVGGLQYNLDRPASIFYNNTMMNTQLIQSAATADVRKFIFVSSACAYPENTPKPTLEDSLWQGYPESSNGPYGISKRIALTQLEACKKQWGMDYEYPILANLYGPGDSSDHVIPMLIGKFRSAAKVKNGLGNVFDSPVYIWGDGSQTRDFLHVRDAVRAIKMLIDKDIGRPINIARGQSISIMTLVGYLVRLLDYKGEVIFDNEKPIGEMHRHYDISHARELLGWQPEIKMEDGLREMCNL